MFLLSPSDFKKNLNERNAQKILHDEHKGKGEWVVIDPRDYHDLQDSFFNMIKTAYEPIGGHIKVHQPSDVFADPEWNYFVATDLDDDDDFDVVMISKKDQTGRKSVAVGHDGSKIAKATYVNTQAENMKKPGNYAEVSGKVAEIVVAKGGHVVNDKDTVEKVLKKPVTWYGSNPENPNEPGDGWYSRKIAGEDHLKMMVGYPNV